MPNHDLQNRIAFERWMTGNLKQRYDEVLREPVPADLAALLEAARGSL